MRKDIDLSFKRHPLTGDLATKSDSSAIRQSLVNLIRTNFGDRGFNIELGTNVDSMLFENMTLLTANNLRDNISNTIRNFEPNVELIDVEVYEENYGMFIKIFYTELNNPNEQTIVVEMKRIR